MHVDTAPVIFEHVASGKVGGFLAGNWLSSSIVGLGMFSPELHKKLTESSMGREGRVESKYLH